MLGRSIFTRHACIFTRYYNNNNFIGGYKMAKSFPILCGSIAGSIGGMGVIMHNAAYKALGLNYSYVSFEPDNLEHTMKGMRALGIRGLAVTMPFKQAVIQYLDELDESAEIIGAVNTVVNVNGLLKGYNTDWVGVINSLEEVTDLTAKKVVVLGAGGAGRAVIYALKKYSESIEVYNRDEHAGKEVCDYFGVKYAGVAGDIIQSVDYDILINATSVGFKGTETILTANQMKSDKIVLDAVFIPIETTFVKIAKSLGCIAIPGYRMLIHQACYQFELYTGLKAPFDVMEKALLDKINSNYPQ
jgi:shikimate dehydrogenase